MNLTAISRYISLILRHKPEVIGIRLDEHGWADVDALIQGIQNTKEPAFSRELLDEIVRTDSKQRYAYNEDRTLIRASQGHSIPVDVELTQAMPPEISDTGNTRCPRSIFRGQPSFSRNPIISSLVKP